MMHRRIARAAGIAVAITAGIAALATPAAAPAHAQDKPPAAARDVAREFAAAKRLLDAKSWKEAKAALEKLLAAVPGDPGVLAILPDIEEALRTATFRAEWKSPDVRSLMGPGCTSYVPSTRIAEFVTRPGREDEGWVGGSGGVAVFDRPLDGDVSLSFSWDLVRDLTIHPPPVVLLAYDSERSTGYVVRMATFANADRSGVIGSGIVLRLDGEGKEAEIGKSSGTRIGDESYSRIVVRYDRKGATFTVTSGTSEVARATCSKHRAGTVAMITGDSGFPATVKVTGKLTEQWIRRAVARAESEAFRNWQAGWKRESALPAWVTEHEERTSREAGRLPADATDPQRAWFADSLAKAWDGDPRDLEAAIGKSSAREPATEWYLDAVVALASGRFEQAEDLFRRVLGEEASFAPARAGVGIALMRAGRADEARPHLDEARAILPSFPPLVVADAWAAINAGDMKKAADLLAKAAAAGATSRGLTEVRKILQRIEKGPQWVKRFDFETEHFRISSDHSITACGDVGKQLEDAFASYARHFRGAPKSGKAQVYVFSGMDGYLDYAGDLGTSIEGTLGVYLPRLRQLAVFLHDDRATLWDTVRHEGFHQYLHRITDGVPIWFNEGAAEYFGFTRRKAGKTVLGAAGGTQRELLALMRKGFTPLRELFVMEQPSFMRKPEVHYVQAWSVIHFLRETKDPRFAGLLDRYLDAILARKSAEEAYDAVLEPVIEPLIDAWTSHVDGVVSGR